MVTHLPLKQVSLGSSPSPAANMKKYIIVCIGVSITFLTGIILFALFDWLLGFTNANFEESVFYDLFLGPIIGLFLSILFTFVVKNRWNLSWYILLAWIPGILLVIIILYLIILSIPVRR